jgi:hypothetical protein
MEKMIQIPEDEALALRDIWSCAAKVNWAAYDRLRERILSLTEVSNEQDDLQHRDCERT